MKNGRHNAGRYGDEDKKFEFASPDARGVGRTASHRYLPAEAKRVTGGKGGRVSEIANEGEAFGEMDFRARWWPAPDAWQ